MKSLPNKSIDLIVTDPPYNIGKAGWDNIPDYLDWSMSWLKEAIRVLKDNGTLWFFHMNFAFLAELHVRLTKETPLRHKQLIIIDKGLQSIAGRTGDTLRSYPRATEYLQFYTFDDPTGAEQLGPEYARINPMAKYLTEEFKRAGVSNREISTLFPSKTGGLTGCVSNWTMGLNFPTKEQYERIRKYLNYEYLRKEYEYLRKEYEELRKEYEELRKEYEELRYTFNLQSGLTDVWKVNFYKDLSIEHETPKPLSLLRRIIQTASKDGDLVLDPFAGSGNTLIAADQTKRRWIGFEKDSDHFATANSRIAEMRAHPSILNF